MSKLSAWLTPDTAPTSSRCWRVSLPSGEKWEAAFRGAIRLLAIPENWEQFGTLTPEEAAQEFIEANFLSYKMRLCMPVGTFFHFGGDTVPDGSLLCDGASYDTDDYPDLFEAIGYLWGGAGGSFNLPDMRDRFAMGVGSGGAVADSGGLEEVTLSGTHMPNHNHDYGGTVTGLHDVPVGVAPVAIPNPIPEQTSSEGGGNPHENMPPYRALLPCITYE